MDYALNIQIYDINIQYNVMNIYFLFQKAPLAANSKRAILHQLHEYNKTIYKKVR